MAPDTPDTQTREFGFSEATIREGIRMLTVLFPSVAFFAGVFLWYLTGCTIGTAFGCAGTVLLAIGSIVAIEVILLNRRSRKLKVLVHEDRIVKQCGKKQHVLLWKDIARMKTTYRKGRAIFQITLYANRPNIPLDLFGFTDMEVLATLIKERISEGVAIREKRWKLDWRSPFIMSAVVLPVMAATLVIASMGSKAVHILPGVAALSFGVFLLASRPLTKSDIGFKWIELIAGTGMLIAGIYMLIRVL